MKLFEVTLKYFICADTENNAKDEMYKAFGVNYASMELKEIKAGFHILPTEEEDIQF